MSTSDSSLLTQSLIDLNTRSVEMEQKQDAGFFRALLSVQLIFRRANGTVIGKSGPDGFLEGLAKPSQFTSRRAEDVSVTVIGDRALVTLIVVGALANGSVGRYRNIRLFSRSGSQWVMEFWYNYELTSP